MRKAFLELERKAEKLEKEYGSLEDFVVSTTNLHFPHKMRIEVDFELLQVYKDLEDLQTSDLVDFEKFEEDYGEFG